MYPKSANPTSQSRYQHPLLQVPKKHDHFKFQLPNTNRNMRSAYDAPKYAVPKSNSTGLYKTCPHVAKRGSNANRSNGRPASPQRKPARDNTQVIFERFTPFGNNTMKSTNNTIWTNTTNKTVVQKNVKNVVQKTQTKKTQNLASSKKCGRPDSSSSQNSSTTGRSVNIQPQQKIAVSEATKPCDHNVNKNTNQSQTSSNINRSQQQMGIVPEIPEVHEPVANKNLAQPQIRASVHPSPQAKGGVQELQKSCEHNVVKNVTQTQMLNNVNQETQQKMGDTVGCKTCEHNVNKNTDHNRLHKNVVPEGVKKNEQNTGRNVTHRQAGGKKVSQQKANTPVGIEQVNKNKQLKNAAAEDAEAENKPIIEVYKKCQLPRQYPCEYPKCSNLNFKKVTQDLANIIKNFQKQINEVSVPSVQMEQVPSAMIKPKMKEFFKNSTSPPDNNNDNNNNNNKTNNNKNPNNKNKNDTNRNQNLNNTSQNCFSQRSSSTLSSLNKRTSSKSLTARSGLLSRHSFTPFRSLTQHNMLPRSSSSRGFSHRPLYTDPLKELKTEVQTAIRERKTFTIRGQFHPIRKALLARGWVEKYHPSYKDRLNNSISRYHSHTIAELLTLMRKEDLTAMCKNLIKSKLLGGYQVDFYWGTNDEAFRENPDKIKLTIINKLKKEIFSYTNKQGLSDASKCSYWYQKYNVSKLNHPRTYSLGKNGDLKGFIDDFHCTAVMSLLKWVVKMNATKECKLMSPSGKIPMETYDFALNECCKFIKKARHEDIDMKIPEATENEWNQFLDYFYKLIHYNNHFKAEGKETEESLVRKSNYILNNLKSFYHFVDMDGMMNIWILKPTASSRGRGIHMCRTLQYVLKIIKQNHNIRYIIQKYIERPLLIYNTKFDIRQWFVISNCCPLTIWMYKECYLRFSSQTYNLRKLHESIHLTNNSVQCKYKNNFLDAALPSYNMWDSQQFESYLSNIGYPTAFRDIIYPGMKQCITAAVLMHQDKMVVRKNCFELYGADFILTEDFQPWLLEINSSPALYSSTPVTARMCPKVLEDVIKVVIDYTRNNKANTGSFEMVYRQQQTKLPAPGALEIKGTPLKSNYFFNGPDQELPDKSPMPSLSDPLAVVEHGQDCLKMFGDEIKKTLKNLLQIIQNEKQKRGLDKNQIKN